MSTVGPPGAVGPAGATGAFTRDGISCNACGASVHYEPDEGLHFHDKPAPDCPEPILPSQLRSNR